MDYYVYMLLCDQKTFYVGISDNVLRRLKEHRNKDSVFTKKFSDIQLLYCEKYRSKYAAASRERQIKGWSRSKKQLLIDRKIGINRIELAEVLGENG